MKSVQQTAVLLRSHLKDNFAELKKASKNIKNPPSLIARTYLEGRFSELQMLIAEISVIDALNAADADGNRQINKVELVKAKELAVTAYRELKALCPPPSNRSAEKSFFSCLNTYLDKDPAK